MNRSIFPIICLLGISLSGVADLSNPSGWWKLDEGSDTAAYDSSGKGHHGILMNMDPNLCWIPGKDGGALLFDDIDDYIEIPEYAGVTGGSPRSICCWIRANSGGTILSYGKEEAGGLCAFVTGLFLGVGTGENARVTGNTKVIDNQWHHIAAIFEDTNQDGVIMVQEIQLYVDGLLESSEYVKPQQVIDTSPGTNIHIGAMDLNGNVVNYWGGSIDDIRIYNGSISEDILTRIMYGWFDLPGAGTADNPYQISTAEQLISIGDIPALLDNYYVLQNDIDLSGYTFNTAVIASISVSSHHSVIGSPFTGVFDGNGHVLANLHIEGNSSCTIGLFGEIQEGGIVKDLHLRNVYITSRDPLAAGGMAGYNYGEITECTVEGEFAGSEFGGICGYNAYWTEPVGIIRDCEADILVTNGESFGGLVYRNDGIIQTSIARINAINCLDFGGLASWNWGTIIGSSTNLDVSDGMDFGGLVNLNYYGNIEECNSTVVGTGEGTIGGLIKQNYTEYPLVDCSAQLIMETEQLGTTLGGLIGRNDRGDVIGCDSDCTTQYRFGNYYLGGLIGYNGPSNNMILDCSVDYDFTLYRVHYVLESRWGGLIGVNEGGVISFCTTRGRGNFTESDVGFGGLIGTNHNGNINYCFSQFDLTGNSGFPFCGGLVGSNESDGLNLNIRYCRAEGSMIGIWSGGGLVYRNLSGIAQCSTDVYIVGQQNIGGLVGLNNGWKITDCYAEGSVSGNAHVGGLIGYQNGQLFNSYADCKVTGVDLVGGIAGYFYDPPESSYYIAGNGPYNGYGIPLSEPNMMIQSSFVGWDFVGEDINGTEDIWTICEGTNYPRFVWQVPKGDFVCPDGVGIEDADAFGGCWLAQVDLDTELEDDGDAVVSLSELARIGQYWLAVGCGECGGMDLTGEGEVTMEDLSAVAGDWLAAVYPECGMADLNGDDFVDLADWAVFAAGWIGPEAR